MSRLFTHATSNKDKRFHAVATAGSVKGTSGSITGKPTAFWVGLRETAKRHKTQFAVSD
jgi:hypothetical protein